MKSNSNTNYQKKLDKIIETLEAEKKIKNNSSKPSLLLHACCAPCSSYVIEYLSKYFSIDIYYYNPNIYPEKEFEKRLEEIKSFVKRFPFSTGIQIFSVPYNVEDFFNATNVRNEPELQKESERGERCRRCYKLRIEKTYQFAQKNGYDWFTTTLSISPYKECQND